MKDKDDNELKKYKVDGLSMKNLKHAVKQSQHALPGTRPSPTIINHAGQENPYESLYGKEWKKILQSSAMKRSISINDLVKQIYENSKKLFVGSKYEDNCFFYYDALTLMTSTSCKRFLQETNIIDHWILPQQGCNKKTKFANRPVGNSPEVMPLDSNLNKDLHEGVSWLCAVTARLDDSDPNKFSKTTPKRALSAYRRAWYPTFLPEGFPNSQRIVRDVDRVVDEVYLRIFRARGVVVKGLGTRRGRRNDLGLGKLPRGGK